MRRTAPAVALALLLPATACGSADESTAASARTTATATATAAPDQQTLRAEIAAGTPPRDLTWHYATPPSSWRRIDTQAAQGTTQWQVGQTRCGVSLAQPSGVGTAAAPTSDDVVDKSVSDLAAGVPGTPTPRVTARGDRLLTDDVRGLDGTARARFASRTVSFGSGIQGYFLGYRAGDFALQMSAVCGQGAFPARAAEIQRFVRGLAAETTY